MMSPRHWPDNHRLWLLLLLIVMVALQLPLILNPGYFSHDELQWAAFAKAGTATPWRDVHAFQYRPLTFTLWMALSRAFFATPIVFHLALVAWGTLNALLLCIVGRGFGLPPWPAAMGALVFVLGPFASFTHGWVGCIGDVLWLSCALLICVLVQRTHRRLCAALVAAILTGTALLAKEAAFAIPPLLALTFWLDGRKQTWLAAMLASALVATGYLGLRLDALLHAPHEGAQYALSALNLPQRWLEYQLFAPIPPLLESFTTLQRSGPALLAGLLWLTLLASLWQANRRLTMLFLLGGIAALLPVLPLASSWNHYGYGFAAITAMSVAAAWPQASRMGRVMIATFACLSALHGASVMLRIQQVGNIQAVFSPALAHVLRTHPAGITLQLAPDAKDWIFVRLTHNIPSYQGVAIGNRVRIVPTNTPADYRIHADGTLQELR